MMYAVAVGEMFDGINFFGPFEEFEDAMLWGDRETDNYWVVELTEPLNVTA